MNIAIFIFYNTASGWQKIFNFSREFQHCKLITYDGQHMVFHSLNAAGMHTEVLRDVDVEKVIDKLKRIPEVSAVVAVNIAKRAAHIWKPLLLRSCNEHVRLVTGIDTGWTLNPKSLYRKLVTKHSKHYNLLTHWRRES